MSARTPDHLGSSDYKVGAAPIGRFSLGGRRFTRLMSGEIRINLLDDPRWQLGPVGFWRFGRDDVENPTVDRVHDIDNSLSRGLFGGYVRRKPREIRKNAGVGA